MRFKLIEISAIKKAKENLKNVVIESPLQKSHRYSELLNSSIHLKREDLQKVRSFKIRGAYNKISSLSEFNQTIIRRISKYLDINTKFRNSSEFVINGDRVDRLIQLCEKVKATTYLSAPAAKNYINDEFDNLNINLKWMEYGPYKEYKQSEYEFTHHVSIIDTIATLGKSTKDHIFGRF